MVTIIYPSRGRPQQAKETAEKWISRIGLQQDQFELILSLDNDDLELWNYPIHMPCVNYTIFRGDNRSAIDAINTPARFYSAYRNEPNDFLIVISDDFDCPENWGLDLDVFSTSQIIFGSKWILKTQDGIQPWVITLPIMSWDYFRLFNYIYHPDYLHDWCDTEMTCVAELLGLKTEGSLKFPHNHYSITSKVKDATAERADSHFEQGRKVFQERINRNFDLPADQIVGTMTPNFYTRMKTAILNNQLSPNTNFRFQ